MSRTGISEWILRFCSRPSESCLRAADPSDGMDGRNEVDRMNDDLQWNREGKLQVLLVLNV